MSQVRRRLLLAWGGAFLLPRLVQAQQTARIRRIAVFFPGSETDRESQLWLAVLRQGLQDSGWKVGNNLRIDDRYSEGDSTRMSKVARDLIASKPEVIVTTGTVATSAIRQQTLSIPIVFVLVSDPVALGFVTNLARPNGNITGFAIYEFSIAEKWLQIVRECAPKVNRISVIFQPAVASWPSYVRAMEASAPKLGIEVVLASVQDLAEIESRFREIPKSRNEGLVVLPGPLTIAHRERIIALAAQYQLPAIYAYSLFARSGGLMSYGLDVPDLFRNGATYVDRILKGAKPSDLPVQQPTKFEFVINLKTAKALGLTIPQSMLARSDKVIE